MLPRRMIVPDGALTIQNCQLPLPVTQVVALAELARHNETLPLRLIASERARLMAATTSFACVVSRLLTVRFRNDGTASASRTLATVIVVISSRRVKPATPLRSVPVVIPALCPVPVRDRACIAATKIARRHTGRCAGLLKLRRASNASRLEFDSQDFLNLSLITFP